MGSRHIRLVAFASAMVAIAASSACLLTTSLDGLEDPPHTTDAMSNDGQVDLPGIDASTDSGTPTIDGGPDATPSKYATEVLADQPVLYFRFGEPAGESKVRDEVSGLVVNFPLVGNVTLGVSGALTNESNTAVRFGADGRIDLPAGQEFADRAPFTVELWVKQSTATPPIAFLVDHEKFDPERLGWTLVGGDAFSIELFGPSGIVSTAATGSSRDGWHHLAGVMEGPSALRLYVDGVLKATNPAPIPIPAIDVPYSVGHQNCSPCGSNSFVGELDELAIYPTALSQSRLLAHIGASR